MRAILIHGMGRTPLSMALLAYRLRKANIKVNLFGYCVTLEKFNACANRLKTFIGQRTTGECYILVAHSLGSVLSRQVITRLDHPPSAVFFLAPPTVACLSATRLCYLPWYRLLAGEMGQLLADSQFMKALPTPLVPTYIYSGSAGFTGKLSPFGDEPNDGILTVKETQLTGAIGRTLPSLHTFIMNNPDVAADIIKESRQFPPK